jgi:small subunit ribosomal protein S21
MDTEIHPLSPFTFSPLTSLASSTELAVKVKVVVGDGEPVESALRRFKREINKSGHLIELRHKRYFENSQDEIKRKIKEARLRKKFERMAKRRAANRT